MILGTKSPTRADVGRERAAVHFAWWPCRLSDGRTAWFERVVVVERCAILSAERDVEVPAYYADVCPGIWGPRWRRARVVRFAEFIP